MRRRSTSNARSANTTWSLRGSERLLWDGLNAVTRDVLVLLVGFVLLSGLAAVGMKGYLLYKAIRARQATTGLPLDSPERMVADDLLLDNAGRIILALVTTGFGAVFTYAVLTAPDPPNGSDTYDINQASIILLVLLMLLGVVELLQGVRGLVSMQRLNAAIRELRRPPDVCMATTFEGCPYVSPERLLEIRAKALDLAGDIAELGADARD